MVNTTPSGLILPPCSASGDGAVGAPFTGVVTSVGSEVSEKFKVGDRIVFSDMSAPYVIDGEDGTVLVLADSDIVAILKEE